jgi:hypothetical protein
MAKTLIVKILEASRLLASDHAYNHARFIYFLVNKEGEYTFNSRDIGRQIRNLVLPLDVLDEFYKSGGTKHPESHKRISCSVTALLARGIIKSIGASCYKFDPSSLDSYVKQKVARVTIEMSEDEARERYTKRTLYFIGDSEVIPAHYKKFVTEFPELKHLVKTQEYVPSVDGYPIVSVEYA